MDDAFVEELGCISLYSYIKPQQNAKTYMLFRAVYPYIPTSNRNKPISVEPKALAVYPYIPTSNRNMLRYYVNSPLLYILIFLHQTATQ